MAQIIKNVKVSWDTTGVDLNLCKGFNVALAESGTDPKDEVVAYGLAGPSAPFEFTFKNAVLDNAVTYVAWVQTIYPGDDSDWVSTAGFVSVDDGTATIPTQAAVDAADGATWGDNISNQPTDVSQINQQQGLLLESIASDFSESFDGPNALDNWQVYAGAGERVIETAADSAFGGKVLKIGNNSGDDTTWVVHKRLIPFDPTRIYRTKVRLKRTAGTGNVYLGFVGVAADGVTLVNVSGSNTHGSQHYHAASNAAPETTYAEYVGYTEGFGASEGTYAVGTEETPGVMHPDVRYLRPMILANYPTVAGITYVDSFVVESKAGGGSGTWEDVYAASGNAGLPSTYIQSLAANKIAAGTITAAVSMNALTFNGGSMNINNKMIVASDGTTTIQSGTTGARMIIKNDVIKVYDASGVLRVKMGNLLV